MTQSISPTNITATQDADGTRVIFVALTENGGSPMPKLKPFPDGECEGCPVPKLYCAMCNKRKLWQEKERAFGGEAIVYKPKGRKNDVQRDDQ